jgi:hypothetical protein
MYRRQNLYPAVKNCRAISATIIESESNPGTEGVALSTCPGKVIDPPALGLTGSKNSPLDSGVQNHPLVSIIAATSRHVTFSVFRVPSAAMSGASSVCRQKAPDTEVSTLLLFLMRELGGLALVLSVLFFFGSRNPVRNVAIVNANCGPLHPGNYTVAVGLYAGHSPTLSWLLNLGAIADSVGTGSCALFHAAATEC